jgi:hypothetical protein
MSRSWQRPLRIGDTVLIERAIPRWVNKIGTLTERADDMNGYPWCVTVRGVGEVWCSDEHMLLLDLPSDRDRITLEEWLDA